MEKFITSMAANIIFPKAAHKCQIAWLSEEKKQDQYSWLLCFLQILESTLKKSQESSYCNRKMQNRK